MPRQRRPGRLLDRREPGGRVVVGDHEQTGGDGDPDQRAQVELPPVLLDPVGEGDAVHQPVGHRNEGQRRQPPRQDQALVQRPLDVPRRRFDRERADDRSDDRHAAEHQWEDCDAGGVARRKGQDPEQHDGNRGDRVGFEKVGGHSRAVADVVTDVVGDHRRVARIVLRNAGLDLADQVGADVGGLGEDSAAKPGEDRDQRAAEPEPDQRVNGVPRAFADAPGEDPVVAGDTQQRQPNDQQAGHRATPEGDVQRPSDTTACGLGDPGVRAHRHVHADVASRRRQHPADQEPDRDPDVLDRYQDDEQDHPNARDRRVLPVQVGSRALLDRSRDRTHPLVSWRQGEQRLRGQDAIDDGGGRADERHDHAVVRQKAGQNFSSLVLQGPDFGRAAYRQTARNESIAFSPNSGLSGEGLLARDPETTAALRGPGLARARRLGLCFRCCAARRRRRALVGRTGGIGVGGIWVGGI